MWAAYNLISSQPLLVLVLLLVLYVCTTLGAAIQFPFVIVWSSQRERDPVRNGQSVKKEHNAGWES